MTVRTLAEVDDALITAHLAGREYRRLGEHMLAGLWSEHVDRLLDERRDLMGLTPAGSGV
jgi:hypothetical protein